MLNECLMHEILKMPLCKEEKGDGIELSLELSIGGNYGKFDGKNDEGLNNNDHGVSRFDFSCGKQENGGGILDLQRKRDIQALRRQEARKKREEKLQKSRGVNVGGDFVNDKLILEAQKFQTRAEDREIKENDGVSEDLCRKREKNGVKEVENDLNLSLFSEKKQAKVNGFGYPWGLNAYSGAYLNVNNGINGNVSGVSSIDSGFSYGKNEGGNCSVERSSSVASDYQGTSHRGEINSDAASHSSIPHPLQNPLAPRTKNTFELLEGNESSSQTEKVPSSSAAQGSNFTKFAPAPKLDTSCSTSENRTSPTSGRLIERPPKPPMKNDNATSLPHMPCVSATGNGPNGKTIRGFLYKYTKSEVSIMCACHGSSFSPAGFVEHAGCTNVSHPLRHITIIPATFTYRIH